MLAVSHTNRPDTNSVVRRWISNSCDDFRRVEEVATEKTLALEESSREASQAVSVAQERIARLEAEHALALKENGKTSVRQRALERELARMRSRWDSRSVSLSCGHHVFRLHNRRDGSRQLFFLFQLETSWYIFLYVPFLSKTAEPLLDLVWRA